VLPPVSPFHSLTRKNDASDERRRASAQASDCWWEESRQIERPYGGDEWVLLDETQGERANSSHATTTTKRHGMLIIYFYTSEAIWRVEVRVGGLNYVLDHFDDHPTTTSTTITSHLL